MVSSMGKIKLKRKERRVQKKKLRQQNVTKAVDKKNFCYTAEKNTACCNDFCPTYKTNRITKP